MAAVTDEFTQELNANWKVVIENALEGYHVPAVHSQTFMQVDGMDSAQNAAHFFFDGGPHSHLEHAASPEWLARFSRMEKKIGQWPWRFEHYTHHHIFPNLTVTSFMGYSFHVQVFQPTKCEKTTVQSRTIGMHLTDATPAGQKMMAQIHADGHQFTHRVFAEDADICAKVHLGLRDAYRLAVLGGEIEDRVKHFQTHYLKYFSNF
jgi:phenylpropionate dioxygenase-like ring-hydroxylating dioxygenase large terminal subunit